MTELSPGAAVTPDGPLESMVDLNGTSGPLLASTEAKVPMEIREPVCLRTYNAIIKRLLCALDCAPGDRSRSGLYIRRRGTYNIVLLHISMMVTFLVLASIYSLLFVFSFTHYFDFYRY